MQRVRELVAQELNAEPEYVGLINKLEPNMTAERRKELIRQFAPRFANSSPIYQVVDLLTYFAHLVRGHFLGGSECKLVHAL